MLVQGTGRFLDMQKLVNQSNRVETPKMFSMHLISTMFPPFQISSFESLL